ncbi:uncharacterized protein [Aegilops tauschii subsp. strangulata]|uniref:Uncharacterized protein n=2 Tax=Aegilops tauschii TaxID=37682 RepID=A0A453LPT1_AEGTS|nr:uncharacterized protein LOC109775564 [Aegilops tauschii subsp. strangulata]XP_044398955.1 uncharacterized protein LOC123122698 [Triticum aestivum]
MAKVEARVETVKSMVIVAEIEGPGYCSGFVAFTEKQYGTHIVTDDNFVKGRERSLKVFFFDNTVLRASIIHRGGGFCSLRTKFHSTCEQIQLIKGNTIPSPALLFPPSSSTTFYHLPSFVTLESAESYPLNLESTRILPTDQVPTLARMFVVDCHYTEETSDRVDRLSSAPVYTLSGSVVGIVVGRFRDSTWKKLALSAKHVSTLIDSLIAVSRNKKTRDGNGSSGNKEKRDGDGSYKDEFAGNKRSKGGDGNYKKLAGNKNSSNSSSKDKANKGAWHKSSFKGKLGGCETSCNVKTRGRRAGDKGKKSDASKW